MPRVLLDRQAEDDLLQIAEHIGVHKRSPKAARRFLEQIQAWFELYASQPEMGERRIELGEGLRSFAFKKRYVVIYRPIENGIDVLRVIHAARDYPRLFRATRPIDPTGI